MPRTSRGFMILDAMIGLAILGMIMLAVTIGMGHERRAANQLAQTRRAVRAAEGALTQLQAGRSVETGSEGMIIQVRDAAGDAIPPGQRWVEVQATVGGQHATLVGLVPAATPGRGIP
jgi:type II secretory pathway pseudopilin PulG